MTHTRSPWKSDKNLGCKKIKGAKSGTHKQAQYKEIAWTVGLWDEDEDLANAQLMARAPELQSAIRAALDLLVPKLPGTWPPERVRKAVEILREAVDED